MNGRRAARRGAPQTLTDKDAVLEGEGRGALLAAVAAHGAEDSHHRHRRATNPHAARSDKERTRACAPRPNPERMERP